MPQNQQLTCELQATSKPGDYALGSVESRAAARALLSIKQSPRPAANTPPEKILDFVVTTIGKRDVPVQVGKWSETQGVWTRFSRLPYGMTIAEAEGNAHA